MERVSRRDRDMKSVTSTANDAATARGATSRARRPRQDLAPRHGALTALLVLAVFYTLYITRELTLPIVLALLLAMVLTPAVRWLARWHVPRALAAAVLVLGLLAGVIYGGYSLSEPASLWLQKSPQIMKDLERKLRPIQEKVEEVDKAAQQVEKITQAQQPRTPTVQVRNPGVRQFVLSQAQQLITSTLIMFFLLYFMLATGDRLVARALWVFRSAPMRARAKEIGARVVHSISVYLGTMALINIAFGAATALLMYALGMPNPVLWGALAAILNFVPYLGALVTLSILSVVALLSFDDLGHALLVPAAFLVLNEIEGDMLTPWLLGRRLSLNPLAIFLGLVFWGWLWGAIGALLAVPIMVTLKEVCDNIERLAPIGRVLAR